MQQTTGTFLNHSFYQKSPRDAQMMRTQALAFSQRGIVVEDAESQEPARRGPTHRAAIKLSPRSSQGKLKDFLRKKQQLTHMQAAQRKALESYYSKRSTASDVKRLTARLYYRKPNPL